MGMLSSIFSKLGLGKDANETPSPLSEGVHSSSTSVAGPTTVATVDVEAQLEKMAAAKSQKLNWRTSIVDLLKLLDIDSSLPARKVLAVELGCPPPLMKKSADMNVWLHKTVLARIAKNGGTVPAELLA